MDIPTFTPFRSPRILSRWMQFLYIAGLLITGAAIVSGIMELNLVSRAMAVGITAEEGEANDVRQQAIGTFQIVCAVVSAISFLVWFYRMNKNLPALGGRGLKFSPGWAVGYFFIPLYNLVRPVQVMREVWHVSDPGKLQSDLSAEGPEIRNDLPTPPLVGWWWGIAIIAGLVGRVAVSMASAPDESIEHVRNTSTVFLVSDSIDMISLLLAFWLVSRLGRWQDERHSLMQTGKRSKEKAVDPLNLDPEFA